MEFFKRRSFAVTNVVSLSMYFGMFGSIFFMSQYLQNVLGNSPLQAGLKLLVWTGATMLVSPAAGYFSERYGSRLFMVAGLALQAIALGWLASEAAVDQSYASMVVPFVLGGAGMALVFAPSANAVLASVRTDQAGQASGATNAIRELGGVLGIAVLSTVFSSHGSYASPQAFVNGLKPTMWVGTAVLAAGALIALALRIQHAEPAIAVGRKRSRQAVSAPHRRRRIEGVEHAFEDRKAARPGGRTPGRADRRGDRGVRADRAARHAGRPDRAPRRRRPAIRVQPVRYQARAVHRRRRARL